MLIPWLSAADGQLPQAEGGRAALAAELARATQNPVADPISVPFQNNTNFNHGPFGHVQNILNIQPVVPVGITSDWNIVTRTILPVVSQPTFQTGEGTIFGLGRPSSLPSCRPGSPAR